MTVEINKRERIVVEKEERKRREKKTNIYEFVTLRSSENYPMSSEKSVSSQTGEERIVWYSINFVQLELEAGLAYPPVETPHSQA